MNETYSFDPNTADSPRDIEDLLYTLNLPPEFDRRCKEASKAAYSIDQMRRHLAANPDLSPYPFGRLVRALAELAGVNLEPVRSSFGIDDLDGIKGENAGPFARLARLLDLSPKKAYDLLKRAVRLREEGFLAEHVPRGGVFRDSLEEWEAQCSTAIRTELEQIQQIVESEYEMG